MIAFYVNAIKGCKSAAQLERVGSVALKWGIEHGYTFEIYVALIGAGRWKRD